MQFGCENLEAWNEAVNFAGDDINMVEKYLQSKNIVGCWNNISIT